MFTVSCIVVFAFAAYLNVSKAIRIVGSVLEETFLSPTVIKVDEIYYAFSPRATRDGKVINARIASSKHFSPAGTFLTRTLCLILARGRCLLMLRCLCRISINWYLADGSFILYYIAIPKNFPEQQHCVAAAASRNITGSYTPQAKPLLCPKTSQQGVGTADPNGFIYDGDRYLVFKNTSGHDSQKTSYVTIEKVEADGYTPAIRTKWTNVITSTKAVENNVEGSVFMKNPSDNGFVLFFTARTYDTTNLRIEYAIAGKNLGPYEQRGVLMKTRNYGGVNNNASTELDERYAPTVWAPVSVVRVRWCWLEYPLVLIVGGLVFLVLTELATRRRHVRP